MTEGPTTRWTAVAVLALLALGPACADDPAPAPAGGAATTAAPTTPASSAAPGAETGPDLDLDVTVAGFAVHLGAVTEADTGAVEVTATWTNLEEDREAQVEVPVVVDIAGESPITVTRTTAVVRPQETVDDVLRFTLPIGSPLDGAFLRFGEEDQEAVRFAVTDPGAAELDLFDPVTIDPPAPASGTTFDYVVDAVGLRRDDLFRHEQAPEGSRVLLVTLTVTVLDDGIYGTDANILPAEQEIVLADGTVVHGDGGLGVPIPFTSNLADGTTATGTLLFVLDGYQPGPVTLRLTADDPAVEIPLELP